jgi:crotonobetainyl-CoA:carnitine CoA-transferase CaiB-like acyl-CoA transferase
VLSCYRVLDLTDEKGFLCGKALGDLGADVIKIERPGGDPARRKGPFYHDIPDPEKSLYWFAFNANKKSITLDIERVDGKEIFKDLVKNTDVVLESFQPGYMESLELGYAVLSRINPGLVMTSVTGFGVEGPYRDYKAPDIVLWALSGIMYTVGDPDRPPLAPSYDHAYLIGAANAAAGTVIALTHRAITAQGQHVDASTQQALVHVSSAEVQGPWAFQKRWLERMGTRRFQVTVGSGESIYAPLIYECKDGCITFTLRVGPWAAKGNQALVAWMKSEGYDPGRLEQWDWKTQDWTSVPTPVEAEEVWNTLRGFFLKHTKTELFDWAIANDVHIGVVNNVRDLLEFRQLAERNFWTKLEHPELGVRLTYPGGFVKMTEAKCGIRLRAPRIGEHNHEVYQDVLGFSREDMVALKTRGII